MSVEAHKDLVATTAQREQFERDGYLVIEEIATEQTLDAIVDELKDVFGHPPRKEGGVDYRYNRIMDAWRVNENVKALALSGSVLRLLEDLYERKPLPFQTLDFRRGTEQDPHSDALHFSTMPEGYMCGVWVALEDIDMDNGPLVYYPGSQKLPFVTPAEIGLAPKWDEYPDYEQYVADLIERERLEPRYGTIRKGQAIVWAANLLHGGAPQKDKDRSRYSQVTHYFFEGCRYYTPMVSEGENVRWRDPVWIA